MVGFQSVSGPLQIHQKQFLGIGSGLSQLSKQQPIGTRLVDVISPKKSKKGGNNDLLQETPQVMTRIKSHRDINRITSPSHSSSTATPHSSTTGHKPLYALPLSQVNLTIGDSSQDTTPVAAHNHSQAHHSVHSHNKTTSVEESPQEKAQAIKRAISPGTGISALKKGNSGQVRPSSKDSHGLKREYKPATLEGLINSRPKD